MRILRTTERYEAGWREQNFIPDDEAAGHAQEGRQGGSRSRQSEEGGGHRLLQGRDRAAVR